MIKDIGAHPERYVSNENENIRRNGERVQVTWMNKAIYDEAGNVSEILCVGIDVTEKWQLEKRLAQAQKMESIGHWPAASLTILTISYPLSSDIRSYR